MSWKDKADAEIQKQEDQARAEREEKLAKLRKKFFCNSCLKTARGPATRVFRGITLWGQEDWDKPFDLYKCSMCDKWTCQNCIHRGICKKCALKS